MGAQRVPAGSGEQLRLLTFLCAGERFTIDVSFVREIVPLPEVTPVPFVPDTVAGIINHRGTIFTLISFARLAGLGSDRPATVVLLRLPEMAVGLAVAAVEGIGTGAAGAFAAAGGVGPPTVPFLRRSSDASGHLVHAIDAELLIDTIYQLPDLARTGEA